MVKKVVDKVSRRLHSNTIGRYYKHINNKKFKSQLANIIKESKENNKEDITIIIGVRDRFDYRLTNSLKSLRNQDYDPDLIKIKLIDYSSKSDLIPKYEQICKDFNVDYIRVNSASNWNRSNCLNIGIKQSKTKYILTSDVDIIFENNYIKTAIKELKNNPRQVILCSCKDSLKNLINPHTNTTNEYQKIKNKSVYRGKFKHKITGTFFGKGINLSLTKYYHLIRGYDEKYKLWGAEDDDLIKRFKYLGLKIKEITKQTSYIHQWHEKFEGVDIKDLNKILYENKKYLMNTNSVIRNKESWGDTPHLSSK